jgi:sec-independent protein translocase protein TatC
MPFLAHLEELRQVLIHSIIAILVGLLAMWALSGHVLELLIARTMPTGTPVVFLGPGEAFTARIKVALTCGALITLPYIFWRFWRFVVPGLLNEERSLVLPMVVSSCLLFYIGGFFGLLVLVPVVIKILLAFSTSSMSPTIAIGMLLGFILRLVLSCGLVFQLPLVTTVLTFAGIVSPQGLLARWRYAVLIIFVLAAVITPGDGPSQLVLGIPVTLLYFISVALSYAVRRRQDQSKPESEAESDSAAEERSHEAARPESAAADEETTAPPGSEEGE